MNHFLETLKGFTCRFPKCSTFFSLFLGRVKPAFSGSEAKFHERTLLFRTVLGPSIENLISYASKPSLLYFLYIYFQR